jgi:MFS family permease
MVDQRQKYVETRLSRVSNVAVIMLGVGAAALSVVVIAPVLGPMSIAIGDGQTAQVIVVMPMLGLAVGGLLGGWLVEHLRMRRAIIGSGLMFAIAGGVGALRPPVAVLLVDCFVLGFSAATMGLGTMMLLGERYADHARSRMLGYSSAFAGMLAASVVWISGLMADSIGWQYVFLEFTVAGFLVTICAFAVRRNAGEAAHEPVVPSKISVIVPAIPVFTANLLVTLIITTSYTHVPLLLAAEGEKSANLTGALMSIQGACGVLAALSYGVAQARFGKFVIATLGVILLIVGSALSAVFHSAVLFATGCAAYGAAMCLLSPYLADTLLRIAPVSARARSFGFFGAAGFLGGFINPFVMLPIREAVGLHGLYGVLAMSCAVVGTTYLVISARRSGMTLE